MGKKDIKLVLDAMKKAVQESDSPREEIVELYSFATENGIDVDLQDVLNHASAESCLDVVQLLLEDLDLELDVEEALRCTRDDDLCAYLAQFIEARSSDEEVLKSSDEEEDDCYDSE